MYSGVQEPDAPHFRNPQSSDPILLGWTQGESQQRSHPSYLSIVLGKKKQNTMTKSKLRTKGFVLASDEIRSLGRHDNR